MARIPLGNFGTSAPEPVPNPRIPAGAAVDMRGVQRIGDAAADIGLAVMERDAKLEAAMGILSGKAQMDRWQYEFKASPIGADGRPRYLTANQDFEAFAGRLTQEAVKNAKTPLAQRAIQQDLANYALQTKQEILTSARKQQTDIQTAGVLNAVQDTLQAPGLSKDERMFRITQAYASLVTSNLMGADDAKKEIMKQRAALEYGERFSSLQSATTKEQVYELRGQFAQFNPLLSPEQNRDLVRLANERIASLDKDAESAVKAKQETTEKSLTDKYVAGTLTIADVQAAQKDLPAATYERWAKAPDVLQKRDAEAVDNPDLYREVQREVLNAYRDPKKLERLRDRVTDLVTGYDPKTKAHGKPALSRDTGRRLLDDIEGYLREFRSEARTQKNEANSQAERDFRAIEGLLGDQFKSAARSRVGRAAQAELAERETRAREDLLKNRGNASEWWETYKKANPDLFEARVSLPSWVVQQGGKADLMATRDKLTEDFKAKRLNRDEYQRRMDQLSEMETKRAQ